MIQGMIVKVLIKQIMKAIEKADDNRIAKSHDKRLKALEKDSHPQCGCNAKKVNKK